MSLAAETPTDICALFASQLQEAFDLAAGKYRACYLPVKIKCAPDYDLIDVDVAYFRRLADELENLER